MKRSSWLVVAGSAVFGIGVAVAQSQPAEQYDNLPPAHNCGVDQAQNAAAGLPPTTGPWTKCEMTVTPPRASAGEHSMDAALNAAGYRSCDHYIYGGGTVFASPLAPRPSNAANHAGCDWTTVGDLVVSLPGARRVFRCLGSRAPIASLNFDYGSNSTSCLSNKYPW